MLLPLYQAMFRCSEYLSNSSASEKGGVSYVVFLQREWMVLILINWDIIPKEY